MRPTIVSTTSWCKRRESVVAVRMTREELYDDFETPSLAMLERSTPDILRLAEIDNVAVALRALERGETVAAGATRVVVAVPIPVGHKLALRDIPRGEAILKYGQVMGRATETIGSGEHVHVHNVEGLRGRGDLAPAGTEKRG